MMQLARPTVDESTLLVSIQAPNAFYAGGRPGSGDVGYSWAVHTHSEDSVRVHHEILLTVMGEIEQRYGIGADRRFLLGFSQPVGLNYRFAATHPREVRGVVGICGGVPKNWEDGPYQQVQAALLHIARSDDEYFPSEVAMRFESRLRVRANDVEFHMLPGTHRYPSKAASVVQPWVDRVFGATRHAAGPSK
jgi:predicted esterase